MEHLQTPLAGLIFPEHHVTPAAPVPPLMLRRILVVVDPDAVEHPAIERAGRIAAGTGAKLELFVCIVEADDADSRAIRRRGLIDFLDELAAPLRARGLAVALSCEWGASFEHGIGLHVVRTKPDLVVKDTHQQSSPSSGALTLADWNLIRQTAPPLLLVRPEPWPTHPAITVCADPSHPADRPESLDTDLVALGSLISNALCGCLDVLHVLQTPPHLPGEAVSAIETARTHGKAREAVERIVSGAANRAAPVPIHFLEGRVAATVIGFAAEYRPNLMLLGASARPRWAYANASGTAAQVLESLTCDLLVVKPAGFVSPLLISDE
jgi:universal stress protein E